MSNTAPRVLARDPEQYEHFMGRWSRRLAGPFLDFSGIVGGGRVLDVGCGTGTLTAALAERGSEAVGIHIRSRQPLNARMIWWSAVPNLSRLALPRRARRVVPRTGKNVVCSV